MERSVTGLRRTLDEAEASPVMDRAQGRRNVLTLYGVGGIGKTTLSHELERRLLADALAEGRDDVVAVRVDLSEDGACDIEGLLLRRRAGPGQLGSRWQAFDLALAAYWARAHPGERTCGWGSRSIPDLWRPWCSGAGHLPTTATSPGRSTSTGRTWWSSPPRRSRTPS
ncbi:hypothetical protein [Kitasatospora purpeofusca]|uniref:hypothetical protein n=1 Tax=Kitasatospora purpeofusca TaxID=67352 RepID=UPI003809A82B